MWKNGTDLVLETMGLNILNDTKQYLKYVMYTVEHAGLLGCDTSTGGVIPSFSVALCYHLQVQAFQEKSILLGQLEMKLAALWSFKMSGTTHLIQRHIPKTDTNHKLCCHEELNLQESYQNLTVCYKSLQSRTYQPDQIQYKQMTFHSFNSLPSKARYYICSPSVEQILDVLSLYMTTTTMMMIVCLLIDHKTLFLLKSSNCQSLMQ